MKRTITTLWVLLVGLLPLSAQQFTNPFEVLVKEGATDVSFQLGGNVDVLIDWGDGTQETVNISSSYGSTVSHTYDAALTATTTVTFESTGITTFKNDFRESGSIIGVGSISAPDLEVFSFSSFKGATLALSKESMIDLSNCPKLKELTIRNAPGLKLGSHPQLKEIRLSSSSSSSSSTDGTYAELSNSELDLSAYPELISIYVVGQKNVKTVNFTGLSKLTSLKWQMGSLSNAPGLKDVTKNELLSELNISGHSLPLSQLPAKNPNVTYTTFNVTYGFDGYILPDDKIEGAKIDLSEMITEYDFDGNVHHGSVVWKTAGYGGKAIDASHYAEENGIFTFAESILGENEESISLQAYFTPALFTIIELTGRASGQVKTNAITLTRESFVVAPATQLSFTTSKEVNTTISMLVEATGEVTAEGLEPATIVVGGEEPTVYTLTAKNVVLKGEITGFTLTDSELTALDVSAMPSLEQINVNSNILKELDFSKNNALTKIEASWCYTDKVTLPEEGGTLEELDLSGNSLKTIDLSPYTELNYCDLSYNDFETINLSSNESLEYLYLNSNMLKSLNLSANISLSELAVNFNDLETLDLSTLESLTYLSCSYNKLYALDVSHNPSLKYLIANMNYDIPSIDVSSCPELRTLELMGMPITTLDLSATPELRKLNIGNTKITTIDISKLELLEEFNAGYTAIESFDFSHNPELQALVIANTKITSLSLPNQNNLVDLYVYSNALDPEEMGRIIEQLPTAPAEDEDGEEFYGMMVIQHKEENETLLDEKGFNPIKVYKQDVVKAKEKNWKILVYVPAFLGQGTYEDYGEGIETSAERIAQGKWHVSTNGKVATLVGAPEGESYALYSFEGSLIKRGAIHSAAEAIAMGSLAKGTYIVVVAGEAVAFVL